MDYRLTWMSLLGLTILLIAPSVFSISMSAARKQEIFELCYGRQRSMGQITPLINGQTNPPLAASVENLIALIEKIENSTTRTMQAKDLAATLLKKFRSDGNVIRTNSFLDQSSYYAGMDKIEDVLLDSTTDVNFDDQTILTTNERCSLYYMLSYQINKTEKASSTSRYNSAYRAPPMNSRPSVGTSRYGTSVNYAPVTLAIKPREYGVGSFRSNTDNAITLNRLLLGVIAGQINSPGLTLRDIFTKLKPDSQYEGITKINVDEVINPLMAVTLSNIMAMAAVKEDKAAVHGVSGSWDNAACTMEYTLNNENPSDATLANIRGGIDGYYIGELAKSLSKTSSGMKLRLSQILRYYYDNVGGRISSTCYCDKSSVTLDDRSIRDTATNYYKVFEIGIKGNLITEEAVTLAIEGKRQQIEAAYVKARMIPAEDAEYCSTGGGMTGKLDCETPTDLFVAIDLQSADADKYKNLTARLINNLNLGIYGSSATVLSLNREDGLTSETGQTFRNNLKHLAWASYNKGCPGCSMTYPREDAYGNSVNAPSADLYLRINDTLRDFEANKWHLSAAPARPFIIMGGSYSARSSDSNIRMARNNLKTNHRDVQIFLLTNAAENDLTDYINAPQDVIKDQELSDVMARELSEKICQVPAVFQYAECRRVSTESNNAFEGYITPGRTQYWAMYPEYFIKSYDISMKFYSAQGNMRVCFGRYPNPEETGRCYGDDEETRKNGEIRIYVSNPCQDRDLQTCEPFYFTISIPDQGMTANNLCTDKKCLNAKQAKFKFTHAGIQCSSAFSLVSSLYLAIILALLSSFYNQSKQF